MQKTKIFNGFCMFKGGLENFLNTFLKYLKYLKYLSILFFAEHFMLFKIKTISLNLKTFC